MGDSSRDGLPVEPSGAAARDERLSRRCYVVEALVRLGRQEEASERLAAWIELGAEAAGR